VLKKQIRALQSMGIHVETGVNIDSSQAEKIEADSDAVFVAGGTWRSLKLGVAGEDAPGVYHALDYLKRKNSGETVPLGDKVIVIGGGSVAIDAARTARRTGSGEVHIVCLETRDLASKDRMPALDQEILEAEEEGIVLHPSLGIREITTSSGVVTGIETRRCVSVSDADGKFDPRYDDAADAPVLQAESVILAIGQAAEIQPFAAGGKVFIGGDMAEGPSTVVQALASAQKAVSAIEELLGTPQPETAADEMQAEYPESHFDAIPRAKSAEIPAAERVQSIFIEDVAGLSESEIRTEALRCVSCGCLAVGPSDIAVALVALDASIVTTRRTLSAQAFFNPTASSSTVLEPDELIREVQIPRPPRGSVQRYTKFTLRKPIDFAIVSVATTISKRNGVCSDARIILGAVAPAPLRIKNAEAMLKGKSINTESAEAASQAAVECVQPLSMNHYKVDIARVLIKRSILGIPE
jgi:CO/xanthine dehydrogenase FAD-binding subunit